MGGKRKLFLILTLNSLMLFFSFLVVLEKGFEADSVSWKTFASVVGFLGFVFFEVAIIKNIINSPNNQTKHGFNSDQ